MKNNQSKVGKKYVVVGTFDKLPRPYLKELNIQENMSKTPTNEGWEERFDKEHQFLYLYLEIDESIVSDVKKRTKDFIRKELAQARKEGYNEGVNSQKEQCNCSCSACNDCVGTQM